MSRLAALLGIDPMMRRESLGLSRRWQSYFLRAAYIAVLGLVLGWEWYDRYDGDVFEDPSELASLGREIFELFSQLQFHLIAILALGSTADLVSREVRQQTLGLLGITPLGALQIAVGKWKSCAAWLALIILSGLPVLALCIYLGGVTADELAKTTCLTFAMMILCSAFGLFCSTLSRSLVANLLGSVLGFIALIIGTMILFSVAEDYSNFKLFDHGGWVHPYIAFWAPFNIIMTSRVQDPLQWVSASMVSGALAAMLVGLAALRIRFLFTAIPRKPLVRSLFERLDRLFEKAYLGRPLWTDRLALWEWNPLLWSEFRSRVAGRLRYFIRVSVALLAVAAIIVRLAAESMVQDAGIRLGFLIIGAFLVLSAVGAGAGAFSKDREEKKWESLITTPLSPGSILTAKFLGTLLSLAHALVVLMAMWGLAAVTFADRSFAPAVLALTVFTLFTAAAGQLISLLVSSTRKAFAITLILVVVVLIAPHVLVNTHRYTGGRRLYADHNQKQQVLLMTSPYAHIDCISDYRRDYFYGAAVNYDKCLGLLLFLYGGLTMSLLATSRVVFNRAAGRVS